MWPLFHTTSSKKKSFCHLILIQFALFFTDPFNCLWGAGGVGKAAEGAGAKHSATSGAGGVAGGDGRDDALTFPVTT